MLLSEGQIEEEDMYVEEVYAELLRWRNAAKRIVSKLHYIPISYVTDIQIENFLEDLERILE